MLDDHVRLHFGPDAKGYVGILNRRKGEISYCTVPRLHETLRHRPKEDLYFSANTFAVPNHSAQYVWQHSAVYSGLDTRAVGIEPEDALEDLRHFYFGSPTLPEPSYVILSGNGLWLIWLIQPVTMQHRWLWQAVQEYVHRVLSLFNPDKHDPSKFIRAAGSVNSSNGYDVRLLTVTGNRYTLEELGAYLPEERLIPPKRRRFKRKRTEPSRPKTSGSRKGLMWARIHDLESLVRLRGGHLENVRNWLLVIYASTLFSATADEDATLSRSMTLNDLLTAPLPRSQVRAIVRTAAKHGYRWTNASILIHLGITPDEENRLVTIIGPVEAARRRKVRQKQQATERRRASGVRGRQAAAQERVRQVLELRKQGAVSNREIARRLGISEGTVRRILKQSGA